MAVGKVEVGHQCCNLPREQALEIAQAAGKDIDEEVLERARENQKGNLMTHQEK